MTPALPSALPINILSVIKEGKLVLPDRLKTLFSMEKSSGDFLDVSQFYPFAPAHKCILDFRCVKPESMNVIQVFARMEIYLGLAPATVQLYINILSKIFMIAAEHGIWDYRLLELNDLKVFLNRYNYSSDQCLKICYALKSLLVVMAAFFGQTFYQMDMDGLCVLIHNYSSKIKAVKNAHKTPDIDSGYFEILEREIPILAADESLKINYRMCAALLWLEIYTGLRPSELTSLKTTSHIVRRTSSGMQADYLMYGVPKLSHGGRDMKYAECYMLPGAVSAYETLLSSREMIPGHEKTDSLFILEGVGRNDSKRFDYYLTNLFTKHLKSISGEMWEEVKVHYLDGKAYSIPSLTQYRVHLCSYLYNQGVRLHIIELGMSHLTDTMLAYYARVKDKTFQNSQKKMDNRIRTRINNDFDLMQHREKGEELLDGFLLALTRFRIFCNRLEDVKAKGYKYEVERYKLKCRNLVSSELEPSLRYLDLIISRDGKESVVLRHPSLMFVLEEIDDIKKELLIWNQKQ